MVARQGKVHSLALYLLSKLFISEPRAAALCASSNDLSNVHDVYFSYFLEWRFSIEKDSAVSLRERDAWIAVNAIA